MKLVECVPNFSEGRRPDVVNAIAPYAGFSGSGRAVTASRAIVRDHRFMP